MESQSKTTQTVSALKLLVLKTGEYDLWSMRMEQYLTFTDHALWEVIVNGDSVSPIASASTGAEGPIPPKTTKQKIERKNELKAKRTLMLAIPNEYLLKFHACKETKSQWEAIKNRFGGNKESKKMQKTILKQNYENFAASTWNNIALIMRNKSDLDTLSMDDLYNNLKVYESKIKGKSSSSSNSQNADDVMFSFFSNQSNAPQLDYEDLEQINADDLEEIDLKWQVAMLTMRVKRFIKKTGRKMDLNDKEIVGFDKTKVECYNCHRRGHFTRECMAPRNQGNINRDAPRRNAPLDTSTTNALVIQDGIGGYDLSFQAEEGITNFTLMAYTSQGSSGSSSSDTKSEVVHSVFNSRESDVDDNLINDRFKTYTRYYMPSRPDLSFAELDDYVYKTKMSETSISKTSKDIVEKPKTVRPSDPIIEDWDTDSDNDIVFRPKTDQTKPKFTKINFVKSDENVKSVNKENTHKQVEYPRKGQSPREKPVLNNKGRVTGQRENRPVWNNVQRANHQNKLTRPHLKRNFVLTAVATKLGQVPVNAAKQNSLRAAASISTARPVNTAAPKSKVNDALPKTYSYFKAHSPIIKRLMVDLLHLEDKCPNRKITRKGKIRTRKLDFEDVYFVKELKFNLFSVSQMCDKKNSVLFTKPKCLVLSPDFKLLEKVKSCSKVPNRTTKTSSVENLVPIPSEFKGISEDICDVSSCDYSDAEFGLINSLLSRDISITSLKIDFLPEEFACELDFIDPILPGIDGDDCDKDDFDEEEGEIKE
ncbi:ribonuclease H-like domain-containing protein [Tanacetum coccineum]